MGEHANTRPLGFKDVADYIIIDGEIFFSPSIFGERKSPEIIDLFLNTLLDFFIKLRIEEAVALQAFRALVIGWRDIFLFQTRINEYWLELMNFSNGECISVKLVLRLTTLDEAKKALILNIETANGELPDRNTVS